MSRKRRARSARPTISSTSAGENITDGSAPSASLSRSATTPSRRTRFRLPGALEPDADLVACDPSSTVARDVKPVGAEAHEILIARAARRSQDLQVVDRLEQIRLALAVVADDDEAVGGRRELDAREIAKVAHGEVRRAAPSASLTRP